MSVDERELSKTARERKRRWSAAAMKMAADIAKEKGVTVRLEADGAISISPGAFPGLLVEEPPDPRLKQW